MFCWDSKAFDTSNKYRKSVFDKKEIDSLVRKFNYVSGNQEYITRESFKKNIGFLGIRAVDSFVDRIFNSFDIDSDNKISFDDFFQYMEILKDGTDDQKAQISFNLIYMDKTVYEEQKRRKTKGSNSKQSEFKRTAVLKKKQIDLPMFEQFFEEFYKSWSSITNESIPRDTKISLKIFLHELFQKVGEDGRTTIDLEYYKMLYKDREFMMAFRQINNKLGNLFIKTETESKKTLTTMHRILKKIKIVFERSFPLLNDKFLSQDRVSEKFQKQYFDAQRYKTQNSFNSTFKNQRFDEKSQRATTHFRDSKVSVQKQISDKACEHQNNAFSLKEFLSRNNPFSVKVQSHASHQNLYDNNLRSHISFLEQKILYIEEGLRQIIEESKQIYDEMHQEFLKILQRLEREKQEEDFERAQLLDSNNSKKGVRSGKNRNNKTVFFGDRNFNLVLQIMVGIQMSVRSVSGFQEIIFQEPEDFHLKHTFEMDSGHFGESDILYTFTDYAPNVFNHIRKIYDIDNEHYINSIGPNKMMSALILGKMASFEELMSEGKSGSFFYHTQDGRYLIKTISQKEFYFMRRLLEKYFRHLKDNPTTLMPRFFGLHKLTSILKDSLSKRVHYLIVMNNFFNTKEKIRDMYDLKGSWVKRQNTSGYGVKKDTNFIKEKRRIDIEEDKKVELLDIIEKDSRFFAENNILDYSFLVGIVESPKGSLKRQHSLHGLNRKSTLTEEQTVEAFNQNPMEFKFKSEGKRESYLVGIIDILTEYEYLFDYLSSKKQAEHLLKSCCYDGRGISAVPPQEYQKRFVDFIRKEVFHLKRESSIGNNRNSSNSKQKTRSSVVNSTRLQPEVKVNNSDT